MTIGLIFAVLALLARGLIVQLAKGHLGTGGDLDTLAAQLRPVDIGAFRNLMSESERHFLRNSLPWREFRAIHRQRMLAAIEYIRCATQKCRYPDSARRSSPAEF